MKKQTKTHRDSRTIEPNKPGTAQSAQTFTDQRPEFTLQSKSVKAIKEHTAPLSINSDTPIQAAFDIKDILALLVTGGITLATYLLLCRKHGIPQPTNTGQTTIQTPQKDTTTKKKTTYQITGKAKRRQAAKYRANLKAPHEGDAITDAVHTEKIDIEPERDEQQELPQTSVPKGIPDLKKKPQFETNDPESLDSRILNAPNQAVETELYLEGIRHGGIWGGFMEANIIAIQRGFGTRIYQGAIPAKTDVKRTRAAHDGALQQIAQIGDTTQMRNLDLLYTGDHYVVIDAQQNIVFNPTSDGNCMFEAMFYIMRNGSYDPERNHYARQNAVTNTRALAADGLEELPQAKLDGIAHDYAEERRNLFLLELVIEQILEQFPPEHFSLRFNSGGSINLIDHTQKSSKVQSTDKLFPDLKMKGKPLSELLKTYPKLSQDLSDYYAPKPGPKDDEATQSPEAEDNNTNGFRVEQSHIIHQFFLDLQVKDSLNLKNCSEHLNENMCSNFHYDEQTVCHYSRGKPKWGKQYSIFYIFTDKTNSRVRIIGVGSHEGENPQENKYVLEWLVILQLLWYRRAMDQRNPYRHR